MDLRNYFSLSGSFSRRELALALGILLLVGVALVAMGANFPNLFPRDVYNWLSLSLYLVWGIALGKRSRDLGTTFTYGLLVGSLFPFIGILFLFQGGKKSRERKSTASTLLSPTVVP